MPCNQGPALKLFKPPSKQNHIYEIVRTANENFWTLARLPLVSGILTSIDKKSSHDGKLSDVESQVETKNPKLLGGGTFVITDTTLRESCEDNSPLWVLENLPKDMQIDLHCKNMQGFINHGFVEKKGKNSTTILVPNLTISKYEDKKHGIVYVVNFLNPETDIKMLHFVNNWNSQFGHRFGYAEEPFGVYMQSAFTDPRKFDPALRYTVISWYPGFGVLCNTEGGHLVNITHADGFIYSKNKPQAKVAMAAPAGKQG